jgi:hypothetical protein
VLEVEAVVATLKEEASTQPKALALEAATRLERGSAFRADSNEVRHAERALLVHLPRNPRDVKRFDNAFRLQLHVANGTMGCALDFGSDDLLALGKWVVLRLRWPDLADAIDDKPPLLERLEDIVNNAKLAPGQARESVVNGTSQLTERERAWLDDPSLRRLLQDEPARRIARLDHETFLRVV